MYEVEKPRLFASILSANLLLLQQECQTMLQNGIDGFHIDLMDGHFVPNLSFGPSIVQQLRVTFPNTPLDCHLMAVNPMHWIEKLARAGASSISFHWETVAEKQQAKSIIAYIKQLNVACGIAINPATDVDAIQEVCPMVDYVLVMTVVPGFGGQQLDRNCLKKVAKLRQLFPSLSIQVDGGVTVECIEEVAAAGANLVVSGTGITAQQQQQQGQCIQRMKRALHFQ